MDNESLQTNPPASVTPSQSSVPEPMLTPPVTPKPKGKMPLAAVLLVLLIIFVPLAGAAGYKMSDQKADKDKAALQDQITALNVHEHALPADAIKVSDCIPNMGSHYLTKESDPQFGPFLLVTKSNKVIGTEYMASQDMYTTIPGVVPAVQVVMKDSPMYGWKYDHTEVSRAPEGHEGLPVDHVDVHNYTVTPEEQKQACI